MLEQHHLDFLEYLDETLYVDPTSPSGLRFRVPVGQGRSYKEPDSIVGTPHISQQSDFKGYYKTKLCGKSFGTHVLVALMTRKLGWQPLLKDHLDNPKERHRKLHVDHINHVSGGNGEGNLRIVNHVFNQQSRVHKQLVHYRLQAPSGEIHEGFGTHAFAMQQGLPHHAVIKLVKQKLRSYKGWMNPENPNRPVVGFFVSPSGKRYASHKVTGKFCRKRGINQGSMCNLKKGRVKQYKGWRFIVVG